MSLFELNLVTTLCDVSLLSAVLYEIPFVGDIMEVWRTPTLLYNVDVRVIIISLQSWVYCSHISTCPRESPPTATTIWPHYFLHFQTFHKH